MEFKIKFKALRISLGYDQKKFGNIFGLSQQVISDIERGVSTPSKTLIKYFEYRYSDENIDLRSENHPPGSKNSVSHIGEHSENYNKAVTELFSLIENPEMASKFAQGMVSVIKKDPERFYDKYYSGIIGDCDMLKGIQKNRRKHLRIMN